MELWSDNPAMKFQTDGKASFRIYDRVDEVQPYLVHHNIIINNIYYTYVDYTSVDGLELPYSEFDGYLFSPIKKLGIRN